MNGSQSSGYPPHKHLCRVCGLGSAWCCRHRWTICYIAFVVTVLFFVNVLDLLL